MNTLLNKLLSLLALRRREYVIVDRDFKIIELSLGIERFADCPDETRQGKDVRLGFPELIGVEDILIDVLEEREASFELKAIGRHSVQGNPLYFDFYITKNKLDFYEENPNSIDQLIIFLEDTTQQMVLEQTLVQATNETSLLVSNLEASKTYIDKIITSMADALIVTTSSGIIKTVNRSAQDLFGYSEAELIGKPISLILNENYVLPVASQEHSLLDKSLSNLEVVCQTKSGEKVTVAFSCSAIQTETEGLQNFIYIGRDITERQRTQQRLAVQHATTHIIAESATVDDAIPKILEAIAQTLEWDVGEFWTVDSSTQNPILACVEMWLNPPIFRQQLAEINPPIPLITKDQLVNRIWQSHSPEWMSDITQNENIERSPIELHGAFGFPIQDDNEILGVMAFYSCDVQRFDPDLLEVMAAIGSQLGQFIKRKQAEVALSESEERYRDLFENASDLIQSVTIEGRFVYVNRAWRETLGYSDEEIANLSLFDIIHPDSKSNCENVFRCVARGERVKKCNAEFVTKDGRKISVEGSINCKFVEGKPVATRAIFRDITERLRTEAALRCEQEKSEHLLLNILPEPIAERLKQEPKIIVDDFAEVTVLFADIVGFTELASSMKPIDLLDLLNKIFSIFDQLCEQHSLEKIKTIGDAYMVVGGLPNPQPNHAEAIAQMALDMQAKITQFRNHTGQVFNMRIGINTGPVVAGVIGLKKFSYDLWGDTVNMASRMESHGLPGQIQVTVTTYEKLKEKFLFKERGVIEVKGKGQMTTYFLLGKKN
ncbi:MAG TPA: adenylate/guanylate cyclase [Cyanobacteria bacterium UBA12227]|nr:adenylate/guanylate cyclase [Cyanobacteria bacterium UBA12227]HAX90437.1 adenylate/guanylate cyclase [Cyanobacteria bacterium UBA11370]HBY75630.1 adenylate/guanylate cyclase [Cyanobacteria bacterium UBA11148]